MRKEDVELEKSVVTGKYWVKVFGLKEFAVTNDCVAFSISKETLLNLCQDGLQEIQAEDTEWIKSQQVAK
jgi:uroporphyrinogen-III synthase